MTDVTGIQFLFNGSDVPVEFFDSKIHQPATEKKIYEVIRVEEGIPLFLEDYLERLENSFRLNNAEMPLNLDQIQKMLMRLIKINAHESGPVKLVFGLGDQPFQLAYIMQPHLPKPEEYITGVKTILLHQTRTNPNAKVWNNDLRNRSVALLRQENAYEAILVNQEGFITEASRSNVFLIKRENVFTCSDELILPGITRKKVLEILRSAGIRVNFKAIHPQDLDDYDSCFLTGTARKIVPVRQIEDHFFSVNNKTLQFIAEQFGRTVETYISNNKEK